MPGAFVRMFTVVLLGNYYLHTIRKLITLFFPMKYVRYAYVILPYVDLII